MNSLTRTLCAFALLGMFSLPASATVYTFDVLYAGGGVATLAPGSDDLLTTNLQAGDSFTYSLTAEAGEAWSVLQDESIFPFFALNIANDDGTRNGDFTLDLLLDGVVQLSYAETGTTNFFVHLGTNTVALSAGLLFDEIVLNYALLASSVADTRPTSLLPWPGLAPEQYSPSVIAYRDVANVPEPGSLALMGLALAGFGWVRRRAA